MEPLSPHLFKRLNSAAIPEKPDNINEASKITPEENNKAQ